MGKCHAVQKAIRKIIDNNMSHRQGSAIDKDENERWGQTMEVHELQTDDFGECCWPLRCTRNPYIKSIHLVYFDLVSYYDQHLHATRYAKHWAYEPKR